jgi:trans-2-enoyl-CoA reductase
MFPELFRSTIRALSTTARRLDRAVVYAANGEPTNVLSVLTYPNIPSPPPNSVNIKFLLSPINPADINVIEGVYPNKPRKSDALASGGEGDPVFVAGNEGLARVTAVGQGVHSLNVNDWVIMIKSQAGTWATDRNVAVVDVAKIPDADSLTEVQAATLMVRILFISGKHADGRGPQINPPTAYNMLKDFVDLRPGDWIIQNGANSAAGQAVIQIAAARGLKTINCVRNRFVTILDQKLPGPTKIDPTLQS